MVFQLLWCNVATQCAVRVYGIKPEFQRSGNRESGRQAAAIYEWRRGKRGISGAMRRKA